MQIIHITEINKKDKDMKHLKQKESFKEVALRIKTRLKKERGAVKEVCKRAGFEGNTNYYNALSRSDWNKLRPAEAHLINEALDYIKEINNTKKSIHPLAEKASKILN